MALPEIDGWQYSDGESYVCSSFVAAVYRAGGLLIDIEANESMIVLHTSPGSASLVARHLDSMRSSLDILGTIAGDDTIFIAPTSSRLIKSIIKNNYRRNKFKK